MYSSRRSGYRSYQARGHYQSARAYPAITYVEGPEATRAITAALAIRNDVDANSSKAIGDMADYLSRKGGLTSKQVAYLDVIVNKFNERKAAIKVYYRNIHAAMEAALSSGTIKQPRMTFNFNDGSLVIFYRDGAAAGKIENVTIFQDRRYAGSIASNGEAVLRATLRPENREFLEKLDRDFFGTVSEYGRTTGACCFCSRDLTDPESLKNGFGPICGGRFKMLRFVARDEASEGDEDNAV